MKKRVKKKNSNSIFLVIIIIIVILLIGIFLIFKIPQANSKSNSQGSLPTLGIHNNNQELGIFSGGSGTPSDPYQISTCQELQNIENDLNANYILTGNINCNGFSFHSIKGDCVLSTNGNCQAWNGSFSGIFDGKGYEISGLNSCLFLTINGTIKNFGLLNVNINPAISDYSGNSIISGNLGLIENVHASGKVNAYGVVGGLVGANSGNIINSSSSVDVSGSGGNYAHIGGFVGSNAGNITNCYSTGNVNCSAVINCGGFVGSNAYIYITATGFKSAGNIINSYSTGNVYAIDSYVGGFVGYNYGGNGDIGIPKISNCYSKGNVIGNGVTAYYTYIGGFIGYNSFANISNSYSTGDTDGIGSASGVMANSGFVGYNSGGTIINSFETGTPTGLSLSGVFGSSNSPFQNVYWYSQSGNGHCFVNSTGSFDIGCTKISSLNYFYPSTNSPMSNWDFNNIWTQNNQDYPSFKWKNQISNSCNNDNICEIGENCVNCAADCTCSGTSPDCNPADLYSDEKGCTCQPNWLCTSWSPCENWWQTRSCSDSKSCGTQAGKPLEKQQCCPGGTNGAGFCIDLDNNDKISDSELLYAINKWIIS